MSNPLDVVSEELVLAAVERAERHQRRAGREGVPVWTVMEHLGVARRSARARQARAALDALTDAGVLLRLRRSGAPVWKLSQAGRERLRRAEPQQLPESPQHRAWRDARALAAQEIERFRNDLGELLLKGYFLLGSKERQHSDTLFEYAEQLHQAARRLGSATHCLYEWREPTDERADIDTLEDPGDEQLEREAGARRRARRSGRRNTDLW
jgi:hypothetical protein